MIWALMQISLYFWLHRHKHFSVLTVSSSVTPSNRIFVSDVFLYFSIFVFCFFKQCSPFRMFETKPVHYVRLLNIWCELYCTNTVYCLIMLQLWIRLYTSLETDSILLSWVKQHHHLGGYFYLLFKTNY